MTIPAVPAQAGVSPFQSRSDPSMACRPRTGGGEPQTSAMQPTSATPSPHRRG